MTGFSEAEWMSKKIEQPARWVWLDTAVTQKRAGAALCEWRGVHRKEGPTNSRREKERKILFVCLWGLGGAICLGF